MDSANFPFSLPIFPGMCYTSYHENSWEKGLQTGRGPGKRRDGMKSLFNMDNPVFQALSRVADLAVLNFICLMCCLPVVTMGPALVALNKTVYDLTIERGGGILRTYFKAFRENLRQGIIVGLAGLLAIAALVCDFILLRLYYTGGGYTLLVCLIYLLGFLTTGVLAYLLPLIGRYENRLSQHFQNALILCIRYLPKTIAMVFLHILPLLLALFLPNMLVFTLPFWLFFGLGFIAQADAFLLRPVFEMLERPKEEAQEDEEEGSEEDLEEDPED